jgi:hypothetical protein
LEELLEDHPYGLGKLVMQSHNCLNPANSYTPIRLRFPKKIDTNKTNYKVQIIYTPTSEAGSIQVFRKDKGAASGGTIENGGDLISSGNSYTLNELGYNPQSGGITLYIQGWLQCLRIQWVDVDNLKRPDEYITGNVILKNKVIATDQVKYLVVQEKSFFYRLQFGKPSLPSQDLRCLLASKAIYHRNDLKENCLKLLTSAELIELGFDNNIAGKLSQKNPATGFNAGVYQDFISQKYILTFAGSDDPPDWMENLWQGAGQPLDQYLTAMEIGNILKDSDKKDDFIITGHSLGGGLSSAASVTSGIHAVTFNAAGLHKNTLYIDGDPKKGERYPGSIARYNTASTFIKAYFVDQDMLHQLQESMDFLAKAIGTQIELDGAYDAASFVGIAAFETGATTHIPLAIIIASVLGIGITGYAGYKCHMIDQLLYGFLVKENNWGGIEENLYKP